MKLLPGRAATRHADGNSRSDRFPQVRLHNIVQPQLQACADVVAQLAANLGPAVRGEDQVNAIGQSTGHDFHQLRLKWLKLLEKLREIVNNQEDIAKRHVRQLTPLAHFAEGRHAVNAVFTENKFAFFNDFAHLANDAPDL